MIRSSLTNQEIAALFALLDGNIQSARRYKKLYKIALRDAALVALLLEGITTHEITELRREDLNFSGLLVTPKWGSRRNVKIKSVTRKYLDLYLEDVEDEQILLLVNQRGSPLTPRLIRRVVRNLGKQLGVRLYPGRLIASDNKRTQPKETKN